MRRFLFCALAAMMLGMMAGLNVSCTSCGKGEPKEPVVDNNTSRHDYDGVIPDFTAGVANIQALHRQTMFTLIGGADYEWRNSKVLFNDSIRIDNLDDLKVTNVTDVFFYWSGEGSHVQIISSDIENGTVILPVIYDVWIEDANLSNKEIKLSAEDVLKRLKEWNGVIPSAMSMSLRYPVGPCECNVQWVIGDVYDVIFVDAVTGEVSNWNPAFNPNNKAKGGDFGKPLGEWP